MPPQTPYLSTDPQAGEPEYLSLDPNAGTPLRAPATPATTPAAAPPSGGIGGFVAEATKSLDPRNINAAIQAAFWHPIDTAKGMLAAQDLPRQEALTAFQQGDILTGTRKMVDWLIPILGPRLDEAADYMQQGQVARGLGATTDVGINVAGPKAVGAVAKVVPSVPVLPRIGTRAPAVREAVEFGLREGIPVDVATATSNKFLRGAQHLTEESMLGSTFVSPSARAAQAEALTATGERLAGRTAPAPVTAEQAGQAVRDRVTAQAAAYDAAADVGYSKLRAIEAQQAQQIHQRGGMQAPATAPRPFTSVPMAVDVAPTKAAMRPVYDALVAENALVPFMSGSQKGTALVTLKRLMDGPDLAPLSVADSALGELKDLARVDQTFRRTVGQGIAAKTVANLDAAVRTAATQAGPDAFRALMEGRAATVNKVKTIKVLDQLRDEPVGVFNQATMRKDAGIAQLRALARVAPDELQQVGRAWLEDALTKAKADGGFGRASSLLADWQNLGPQTKQLLFGNAAHVKDLDNFFLLAKKMTETPNPSGSAMQFFKGTEAAALARDAWMGAPGLGTAFTFSAPVVAKLLLSPTTTRLLLQGLRLPVSARAARAAWAGQLGRALESLDTPAPAVVPAGVPADDEARTGGVSPLRFAPSTQ